MNTVAKETDMSTASMTNFGSHLTKCLPESIMKRLKCKVKNRDHSTDDKVKTKRADRPAVLFALAKTNTLACWLTTLGRSISESELQTACPNATQTVS